MGGSLIQLDLNAECLHFACMATLTIRNLPDEVHERLKEQAKRNRRSLNQEVIAELSEIFPKEDLAMQELLKVGKAFYGSLKRPVSAREIREAIEEGRD
jgi:plasmid stability protein